MRALFATTGGAGHFGPLVPLAQACLAAGHDVVVAAPASFADQVARAGLPPAPLGEPSPEALGAVFASLAQRTREESDGVVIREVFGRLDARAALPALQALVDDWRPDVVVREPAEISSLVAAEAAGVPQASVAIGMSEAEAYFAAYLLEPLGELADLVGLDDDRARAVLEEAPRFTCVPLDLDDATSDPGLPPSRARGPLCRYRTDLPAVTGGLPATWGDPDHPLVYVTFGSVAASLGDLEALYPATLAALADQPLRVLMTTGAALDPSTLGPLPANARVERWWPQHDVLPHARAVVGHGGFGTTMAALAAGVPQVVAPLFSRDQFVNAAHVAAAGAGVALVTEAATVGPPPVERLAAALEQVLGTPSCTQQARRLADRMADQVPVPACVTMLEELARA